MHVKSGKIALMGILAAVVTIFIVLASILETSTLFLLSAAAFCVGISIREFGLRMGFAFLITCTILGFLLAPNKIYVITYMGFAIYVYMNEFTYHILARSMFQKIRKPLFFLLKWLFFNLLYATAILLFPKLLFTGAISQQTILVLLLIGQVGFLLFDYAYMYFQRHVWGKLRHKFIK